MSPLPPAPPRGKKRARRGPTTARVFVGLFILWQLLFLFGANLLSILNDIRDNTFGVYHSFFRQDWKKSVNAVAPGWLDHKGHINDALDVYGGLTSRWEDLTGEPQYWKLFAPNISHYVTFVAVELRWDEDPAAAPAPPLPKVGPVAREAPLLAHVARGNEAAQHEPVLLLSDNEPTDPKHFFRVGKFRMRKYESQLDILLRVWREDGETNADAVERWKESIKEHVRKYRDNIAAYLKMRCQDYLARHPGCPEPKQVILIVRRYSIPKPERFSEDWYRPASVPLARWRPQAHPNPDFLGIECFMPRAITDKGVVGKFEKLPR